MVDANYGYEITGTSNEYLDPWPKEISGRISGIFSSWVDW